MKSELRLSEHLELPDHKVIEVWHDGKFIATVTGADGPGVRIISKHLITTTEYDPNFPNSCEVKVDA